MLLTSQRIRLHCLDCIICSIRMSRELIACKLDTTTRRTSVTLASKASSEFPSRERWTRLTGALQPEHCAQLYTDPPRSTATISNVFWLQCGQYGMPSPLLFSIRL